MIHVPVFLKSPCLSSNNLCSDLKVKTLLSPKGENHLTFLFMAFLLQQLKREVNSSLYSSFIWRVRRKRKENLFPTLTYWAISLLSEVARSCPTLCNPMDCSLPGSSLHGILQARGLEWVAISFSRGSSRPRDRTQVSRIPGRCFNLWATREARGVWD